MKEFLRSLGINQEGHESDDGVYIVNIEDSNEYSKVFSKLENSDQVHEVENDSVFDLEKNVLYFESESYDLELYADLEEDSYELIVRQKIEDQL